METNNKIWILKNNRGEFVKACANRKSALYEMESWRGNCVKIGLFADVTPISAVYCDEISFCVVYRDGERCKMVARETLLY